MIKYCGKYTLINGLYFNGEENSYVKNYILYVAIPPESEAIISGSEIQYGIHFNYNNKVLTPEIPLSFEGKNKNVEVLEDDVLIVDIGSKVVLKKISSESSNG